MAKQNDPKNVPTRLVIAGSTVDVTLEVVPIASLRLDPNNPRIRFQISHGTRKKPENADELLAIVRAQPGYDELQKQIRKQGGIHDPLIVRHDGLIVEGNTRFAVVSLLAKPDLSAIQWTRVPVMRLAQSVPERTVQLLMANYHIAGKTNWRPSAQADQIYQLIEVSKVPVEEVADATRMSVKKLWQYVETYKFLIEEVIPEAEAGGKSDRQDILESKFSHAREFITGKKLQAIRDDSSDRKTVARLIATDKIQGAQVRGLPSIMRNAKARDVLGREGFKQASEALKKADPTADSKILKSIQALVSMLKSLDQNDIDLFRKQAKAKAALDELSDAVSTVMAISRDRGRGRGAQ